jgi:hypothetical protein
MTFNFGEYKDWSTHGTCYSPRPRRLRWISCPMGWSILVFTSWKVINCIMLKKYLFLSKEGKSLESFLRRLQTLLNIIVVNIVLSLSIDIMVLCDNLTFSGQTVLNIKHYTINDFPWGEYKDWSTHGTAAPSSVK